MSSPIRSLPFTSRADLPNVPPLSEYLLHLISIKKSNLCVSADVNSTLALLRLAEEVGDYICVLKTHADIIDDFGEKTIKGLQEISSRKKFLIFEDRKFGDIGSTVQAQYTRGPLRIATWAHITNAHIFPGPAIVSALSLAAKAALKTLTLYVSTEITAGPARPVSEDEDSDDENDDDDDDDENPNSEDYSSTDNREYVLLKSEGKKPEGKQSAMAMAFTGRKNSVVTATTTIFQTVEEKRCIPGLRKSESVDRAKNESASREEALEALGDPPLSRGLLLLAEMSSEGHLMTSEYTSACLGMARQHTDFVVGFVAQRSLNSQKGDNFLCFTPGVNLPPEGEGENGGRKGDGLGQQYRTPATVVAKEGCDIIIVGRGILGAHDRKREAERYRREAWRAYEGRISKVGG
ncbi:MAG: orotidine 5'-phosphate decarboxylase [Icmadophila ericetorum]|nr:orotidine 5'-phosphate decarboxylase [Icmadophila ericetorum]